MTTGQHEAVAMEGVPLVEPDRPPAGGIGVVITLLAMFVIFSMIAVTQLFHHWTRAQLYDKDLGRTNPELEELRARDQGLLTNYGVEDKAAGVYRIPIDRAIEVVVEHPEVLAGAAAPTPEGTSASDQAPEGDAG